MNGNYNFHLESEKNFIVTPFKAKGEDIGNIHGGWMADGVPKINNPVLRNCNYLSEIIYEDDNIIFPIIIEQEQNILSSDIDISYNPKKIYVNLIFYIDNVKKIYYT